MDARAQSVARIVVVVLLVVAAVVSGRSVTRADLGAAGLDNSDPVFVPLRWCAVEGSPAVTNPAGAGEPDTDNVLWRRHERASDSEWIPGAGISFRSAMIAAVRDAGSFPVIPDPNPPSAGGPGQLGDILDGELADPRDGTQWRELNEAEASCRQQWDALDAASTENMAGVIAVNLRQIVNLRGERAGYVGLGTFGGFMGATMAQACVQVRPANPTLTFTSPNGVLWLNDNQFTGAATGTRDTLLAHEAGHVLFLGHGNGLDDDADQDVDNYGNGLCDTETSETPGNLMGSSGGTGLTAAQRKIARAIALVIPGANFDPPAALIPGAAVGDDRGDFTGDVDEPVPDLTAAGVHTNTEQGVTSISHKLLGLVSEKTPTSYAFFGDLDSDEGTGGEPASLGLPTNFQGAELVTLVDVEPGSTEPSAAARVWLFDGGDFQEVVDKRILASVVTSFRIETGTPISDSVVVDLPKSVGVPFENEEFRFEAIGFAVDAGGDPDVIPDDPSKGLDVLRVAAPEFPVCAPDGPAEPGGTATVEATGLVPEEPAHVVLGHTLLDEKADADSEGNLKVSFDVPERTEKGPHLVTIGTDDTAITADCFLEVGGDDRDGGDEDGEAAEDNGAGATETSWWEDRPLWLWILLALLLLWILLLLLRRARRD